MALVSCIYSFSEYSNGAARTEIVAIPKPDPRIMKPIHSRNVPSFCIIIMLNADTKILIDITKKEL